MVRVGIFSNGNNGKRDMMRYPGLPVLTCLILLMATAPVWASATMPEMFDRQIHEITQRAEAIEDASGWIPARLGAAATRAIGLKSGKEAWTTYQAILLDMEAAQTSRNSSSSSEPGFIMEWANLLWQLWQAENRIRWIFLRDTFMGMMLIGMGLLLPLWFVIRRWGDQKDVNQKHNGLDPARLPVLFDQPLDFVVPQADPEETRLYRYVKEMGLLSPLTERTLSCFASSPDHPASLQDHLNLPGGLMEHTIRTMVAMSQMAEGHPEDERRLSLLMALCHDSGKLFAYSKAGNRWVDRRLFHDRLSALILSSLPELYVELSPLHREALILALRFYHNPEDLPTSAPPLSHTLMERMHRADTIANEEEADLSRQQVEQVKPYLWDAFCSAIPKLNINRHQGGYPEGFTAGEAVFVLEHALREKTLDQLPEELQQRLPIQRPSGKLHPAWPLLVEVLKEKGILIEEVSGRKANLSSLFNISASGTAYKCVVSLSSDAMAKLAPEAVAQWKQCPPYEVKLSGGRDAG